MSQVQLPSHWKPIQLGEIVKFKSGTSRPKDVTDTPDVQRNIPVYGGNGILGYASQAFSEQRLLVIGRVGAYCGCVHIAEAPNWITDNALYSEQWLIEEFSLDFLAAYLEFYNLNSLQRQGGQPLITQNILHILKINLPPLPEQLAIAHTLRTIQKAREARQRELELERERKAALMQHLFTQGIHNEPLKQTEIGEIPQNWQVVKLGQVSDISTGTTPSTKKTEYYEGSIPFVKTSEIINNRINQTQTYISKQAVKDYNLKIYPPGSVFLAMYGQGKTRGQAALLEIEAATTQNTAAIQPSDQLDSIYLWQWLISQYSKLREAGSQGQISHLNLGYVKAYKMPCPSSQEQSEIADILQACDRKITTLEQEAVFLDELFRAMLEELMTGQLSTLPLAEN